jgi:hypothetical protein
LPYPIKLQKDNGMKNATFKRQTLVSNNNTQNFDAFAIEAQNNLFFFAKVTGATLTGTVRLQVSANKEDWIDVASSSQSMGASGSNHYWNHADLAAPFARIVAQTTTANAATVEVTGYAKE